MVSDSANNAARQPIKDEFLNNISNVVANNGIWLSPNNRYRYNTIDRLLTDTTSNNVRQRDMLEYIAGSSVVHCKDGWEFLGSAIDDLLKGRENHAIHLAYYAELRAAMSLLASYGIGVFNNRHCYVNAAGTVIYSTTNTSGTHAFVWQVLDMWANNHARATDLLELVEVDGKKIKEWVSSDTTFLGPVTIGNLASNWLSLWSMDIRKFSEDRKIRNEGSYRPSNMDLSKKYNGNITTELSYVANKWKSTEPNGTLRFGKTDLYMLREIIDRSFNSHYGSRPSRSDLQGIYNRMISNLGISRNSSTELFITKRIDRNKSEIMRHASLKRLDSRGRPRPLSILSRSYLLLRIATGAVRDSLNYANINFSDIYDWAESEAYKRGIWSDENAITDPDDLWLDIDESCTSIEHAISSGTVNRVNIQQEFSSDVNMLGQHERMFFWGIK